MTNWAFVGASNFARTRMADAVREAGGEVVTVVSSSAERARSFAEDLGIARWHDTLEPVLADPEVDAVYVSSSALPNCQCRE